MHEQPCMIDFDAIYESGYQEITTKKKKNEKLFCEICSTTYLLIVSLVSKAKVYFIGMLYTKP